MSETLGHTYKCGEAMNLDGKGPDEFVECVGRRLEIGGQRGQYAG